MIRLSALAMVMPLLATAVKAQTSDLVFFTDDGTKFTLVVDGDVKNEQPATRVVATGIRTETPMVIVRFEDAGIPQMRKPGYFPLGMEYTVMITTNKKGERVLRPTGEAPLGTAAKAEPAKSAPATFVDDAPAATNGVEQTMAVGGVQQTTTVTTTQESTTGGTSENVNIGFGVNGVGFNMNVGVNDTGMNMGAGTTTTTTTTTQTTTTTSRSTSGQAVEPTAVKPVKEPEVYRMPGYTGPVGCAWPMSSTEFADAKQSIESKSFEDSKMTTAKQVGRDRCFTTEQVKGIMGLFSFEDTKLEFAKYAYERTYDIGNYYKLNDVFSFSSSIDELNNYTQSR